MATTNIEIRHTKDFYPRVVNLMANNNRVDKIVFTLDPYVQDDVDLSAYDCYIMTYGVNGIDEAKLTYSIDGTKMAIEWNIDNYTLSTGQVLSFQVAFKSQDNSAAVWHSYKGIAFSNASIDADEHIASNYPTILRQFEMKIDNMAATVTNAYVVMPYNDYIPVASRAPGKFYINRLNDYDYSCLLETSDGNVLKFSADVISYDASNSRLLADNVQDAIDTLSQRSNGLARFCVNDGNYTDGIEDLLSGSGNVLSFKVGRGYPSVMATRSDGSSFTLSNLNAIDVSEYTDDTYKIYINENSIELLNTELFEQEFAPQDVGNGDVWRNTNTNFAYKYELDGLALSRISNNASKLQDVIFNGSMYVAVGTGVIMTSTDRETWTRINLQSTIHDLWCVDYWNGLFVAGGTTGVVYTSTDGITWSNHTNDNLGNLLSVSHNDTKFVACGSAGRIFSSTDGQNWATSNVGASTQLNRIIYANNLFVVVGHGGYIYTSPDGDTWTLRNSGTTQDLEDVIWDGSQFVAVGWSGAVCTSPDGITWSAKTLNSTYSFLSIDYYDGIYLFGIVNARFVISHDLQSLELLATEGGGNPYRIRNGVVVGDQSMIMKVERDSTWTAFDKVPIGTFTKSLGAISDVYTWEYNRTIIATPTTYGMLRIASVEDEIDCNCTDAGITPSNLYDIIDLRKANTTYCVGDIVGCAYHAEWNLRCTTEGTTSSDHLDTKGVWFSAGDTIVDGNVVWTIVPAGGGSGGSGWTDNPMIATGDMVIGGAVEDAVATPVRFGAPINDGTYYHTVTVSGGAPVHSWGEAGAVTTSATLKYWE